MKLSHLFVGPGLREIQTPKYRRGITMLLYVLAFRATYWSIRAKRAEDEFFRQMTDEMGYAKAQQWLSAAPLPDYVRGFIRGYLTGDGETPPEAPEIDPLTPREFVDQIVHEVNQRRQDADVISMEDVIRDLENSGR